MQLVNHGIGEELLERVKKVASECFKQEREEGFKNSAPVKMLNDLVEKKKQKLNTTTTTVEDDDDEKLESVDWEDVFLLSDDNHWPSNIPGFK